VLVAGQRWSMSFSTYAVCCLFLLLRNFGKTITIHDC
jgi:hypothetical protein